MHLVFISCGVCCGEMAAWVQLLVWSSSCLLWCKWVHSAKQRKNVSAPVAAAAAAAAVNIMSVNDVYRMTAWLHDFCSVLYSMHCWTKSTQIWRQKTQLKWRQKSTMASLTCWRLQLSSTLHSLLVSLYVLSLVIFCYLPSSMRVYVCPSFSVCLIAGYSKKSCGLIFVKCFGFGNLGTRNSWSLFELNLWFFLFWLTWLYLILQNWN